MLPLLCCGLALLCVSGVSHPARLPDLHPTQSSLPRHRQLGRNQSDHSHTRLNRRRSSVPELSPSQYTRENHTRQDHTQEDHTQEEDTQEDHTQEEDTQEDHTQEDHTQGHTREEDTQEEHNEGHSQEDHTREGHTQKDHTQGNLEEGHIHPEHNRSKAKVSGREEGPYWLADCQSLTLQVNLSFHSLAWLPVALFDPSCVDRVSSLNVSHNQLSNLDPDLLNNLTSLEMLLASNNRLTDIPALAQHSVRVVDFSHNLLRSLRPDSLPHTLGHLNVSFNRLTHLPAGVFRNTPNLRVLDLSHNQLQDIAPHAFRSKMESVIWADFSYNELTVFDGWPYMFNPDAAADLQHNRISRFSNSINVTVTSESRGRVDLSHNNLTRLHESDLSIYLNGTAVTPMVMMFYLNWNVQHNPFVCDCLLHWVVDMLTDHLLAYTPDVYSFFTCAAPPFLRGRSLGFIVRHSYLLVCEVLQGCPQGCQCMDTPHHGHVLVSCDPQKHSYSALPAELPVGGLVSLDLSGHSLRRLQAGECDVSRLKVLYVSHNQVSQISPSFLQLASRLEELDLRHNQLTSVPSALQRLSPHGLHLAGNPVRCSCDLVLFGSWAKAVARNLTQTAQAATPTHPRTRTVQSWGPAGTDLLNWLGAEGSHPGAEQDADMGDNPALATAPPVTLDLLILNCSLPDGRQVALVDTSSWGLDCRSLSVSVQVLVWIGVLIGLVVVGVPLGWRWRYKLCVLLSYVRSGILPAPRHQTAEDGERQAGSEMVPPNKRRVYVSVDENDEISVTWLTQWLLPFLESRGHNSLHIYLPLRQEPAGVFKLENRLEVISSSHKFLLVLTSGYISNSVCRKEMDYAFHHHQDLCHKNIVILLKVQHPTSRHGPQRGLAAARQHDNAETDLQGRTPDRLPTPEVNGALRHSRHAAAQVACVQVQVDGSREATGQSKDAAEQQPDSSAHSDSSVTALDGEGGGVGEGRRIAARGTGDILHTRRPLRGTGDILHTRGPPRGTGDNLHTRGIPAGVYIHPPHRPSSPGPARPRTAQEVVVPRAAGDPRGAHAARQGRRTRGQDPRSANAGEESTELGTLQTAGLAGASLSGATGEDGVAAGEDDLDTGEDDLDTGEDDLDTGEDHLDTGEDHAVTDGGGEGAEGIRGHRRSRTRAAERTGSTRCLIPDWPEQQGYGDLCNTTLTGTEHKPRKRREGRPSQRAREELLDERTQYWENGKVKVAEPIRSILKRGRYLSTDRWLFRHQVLVQLSTE